MFTLARFRDSIMGYVSPNKPQRRSRNTSPTSPNFLKERRTSKSTGLSVGGDKSQQVITGRVVKKAAAKSKLADRIQPPRASKEDVAGDAEDPLLTGSEEEVTSRETDEYSPSGEDDESEEIAIRTKKPEFDANETTFVVDEAEDEGKGKGVEDEEGVEHASVDDLEITLVNDEEELEETEDEVQEEDENEEISGDDKVRNFLSNQSGNVARGKSSSVVDWHPDESALWRQLEARGEEPILPAHWAADFRTFGADLFSTNLEETFINSASGNDFQGIRALLTLIALGPRVRERRLAGLEREPLIAKAFNDYMKWAETDGGYIKKKFIPIHTVVSVTSNQSIKHMSKALEDQLALLSLHHRRNLLVNSNENGNVYRRAPPLLYGILIVRSKFIICTYDSSIEAADVHVRTLAAFDFQEDGMDVWNSFAVAIVAITIRNHLMRLRELGEIDTPEEESDSDPDA